MSEPAGQLDWKPRWKFGPIPMLVTRARIKLATRKHLHKYPYMPGAAMEKMGRDPYEISIEGKFETNSIYKDYQNGLMEMGIMRTLVEDEVTEDLVIPWIGTIKACCDEIELVENNTIRSGLDFTATFTEDEDFEFPIETFLRINVKTLSGALADFSERAKGMNVFDEITKAVSFVLGLRDQFLLYRALVESKLLYLEHLFRELDATLDELQDPANILLLDAFGKLWNAVREVYLDLDSKGVELKHYLVPMNMSLHEIALAIPGYGDRALDLLGLNVIEDPYLVLAGTDIRYYDIAS